MAKKDKKFFVPTRHIVGITSLVLSVVLLVVALVVLLLKNMNVVYDFDGSVAAFETTGKALLNGFDVDTKLYSGSEFVRDIQFSFARNSNFVILSIFGLIFFAFQFVVMFVKTRAFRIVCTCLTGVGSILFIVAACLLLAPLGSATISGNGISVYASHTLSFVFLSFSGAFGILSCVSQFFLF